MHNNGQAALCDLVQLSLFEKTLEQENAAHEMLLAQRNRGVEFDQGEAVRGVEGRQHAREAMSVGIGLDHCQDLRPGGQRAHPREVFAHRGKVDLCK